MRYVAVEEHGPVLALPYATQQQEPWQAARVDASLVRLSMVLNRRIPVLIHDCCSPCGCAGSHSVCADGLLAACVLGL